MSKYSVVIVTLALVFRKKNVVYISFIVYSRTKNTLNLGQIVIICPSDSYDNFLTSIFFSLVNIIVTYWQHIIFSGADANLQDKNGNTPLHLCAKSGYVECCRKLTPSGVNVNCVNFEKRTCLHLSAFKGSVECLDFLIASGANINVVDKHKRLPLHYAASRSWFDCTFTLVCSGNNSWIKFLNT